MPRRMVYADNALPPLFPLPLQRGNLELLEAPTVSPEMSITEALPFICERSVLVVDRMRQDELVGLLTSSDIL